MSDKNEILSRLEDGKNYCVCIWSEADVIEVARQMNVTLTSKQVADILDSMERRHDAEYGITWDTIRWHVQEVSA